MCEIGKPLEVIDSVPLVLPAPVRRETEQASEQPVTLEVPAPVEPVTVGK